MADTDSGNPGALRQFVTELKARKVRKNLAIYLSASLTLLGVVNLFSGVYQLPGVIFDIGLILLVCGLPCAALFAWIHGSDERHRFTTKELVFYAIFAVLAVTLSARLLIVPGGRLLPRNARSIAVLPFTNLSDSKDDEFFSDGVTEDIITQLSKIGDLTVISRTSVMQFKGTAKNLPDIGRELDVANILEGSVRRSGDRIRIVAQLIDARNDRHLWAETYDREIKDIFIIQTEVARNIAEALKATLSPGELQRMEKKPTANLDAYGFYLRGREHYYRYTHDDNNRAIDLFKRALATDSSYALAYAGLGDSYAMRASRYGGPPEWLDSAITVSNLAITIDPNLAEAYKALGLAYDCQGKTHEALTYYLRAIDLNPNYAPVVANIGSIQYTLGNCDEALRWHKKAVSLNPGIGHYQSLVGLQYYSLGLDSAAGIWLGKALALQPDMVLPHILQTYIAISRGLLDSARNEIRPVLIAHPDEAPALDAAGDIELVAGKYARAREYFDRACERWGTASPSGMKLAFALENTGNHDEARRMLDENARIFAADIQKFPEDRLVPYLLAQLHAMRKETDQSVEWFRKSVSLGFKDYHWLAVDPLIANVRADPRWQQIEDDLRTRIRAMRDRAVHDDATP